MPPSIGFAYTLLTPENMAIKKAAEEAGVPLVMLNDEQLQHPLQSPRLAQGFDCLLARSSSFTRSLYLSYLHELHGGLTINSHQAQSICGDKVLCTAVLEKAGIPTPKVTIAFSASAALAAANAIGYPCVIKPPVGSWGRMVCKINDSAAAEAVISLKSHLGHYTDKIYYVQQHIDKPDRDIRVFLVGDEIVYSVYRHASEPAAFLTNLNAGAKPELFTLPVDMAETVQRVGDQLGSGIYGIDLIEDKSGRFYVLEVNHAPEFSKASGPKINEVASKIISFAASKAKK
jgi:[lysine-biosynthesis-protein LysW]--L-2-aminoadipate ligase